jgi:hypothetical protein
LSAASAKVCPQNRGKVVAAGPHLVVGDRREGHVVPVEPHRRHVALVREHLPVVEPDVTRRAVVGELVLVGRAADVLQVAEPVALDPGRVLLEPGRQPVLPDVRRLDDVVVDADDHGDLRHRTSEI